MSIDDMRAYGEARIAALKAGLALTAEQEKHWPAFEAAAREFAKLRIERMNAWRARRDQPQQTPQTPQAQPPDSPQAQPQQTPDDPIARMRERGQRMTETGAVLTRLADATAPLYSSLDDAQKRRFATLSRPFLSPMGEFQRGRFDRRMDGPGPRGPMRGWRDDGRDEPRGFARPPGRSHMEPRDLDRTPRQRFQNDDNPPSGPGRSWREERDDNERDDPEARRRL
jgi:hypothetical protein